MKGVTSAGPCLAWLFQKLRKQGLQSIDVYGSTETAGIGYRRDPDAFFELLPFWDRPQGPASLLRNDGREVEAPDRLE